MRTNNLRPRTHSDGQDVTRSVGSLGEGDLLLAEGTLQLLTQPVIYTLLVEMVRAA